MDLDTALSVMMGDEMKSLIPLISEQMSAMKGLKLFGQAGLDGIKKELEQLVYQKVMHSKEQQGLTREQKHVMLKYLMFLKQKQCGCSKEC